jgi:hypothetical protein
VTGAVLVVLTLVLGGWIDRFSSVGDGGVVARQEEIQRPFVTSGKLGETVTGQHFAVRVNGVRGAGRIEESTYRGSGSHETRGLWLILDMSVTAKGKDTIVAYGALRDGRGRVFLASSRVRQPILGGRTFQPEIPVRGEAAFEVPWETASEELTVVLARTTIGQSMDSIVEVSLPRPAPAQLSAWSRAVSAPLKEIR